MGVGVYPGSFNPPTTAHLAIAGAARDAHALEAVVLSVSRSALAKEGVDHPRFDHRIEVLEASVAHLDWLSIRVTDHQLLAHVARGFDLLVVGADKWWQIQDPVWYDGDPAARDAAMAQLPRVAVVPRPDTDLPRPDLPPELILPVPIELTGGVSSTRARAGAVELMTEAARRFAQRTGAWLDPERYERWLDAGSGEGPMG